MVEGINGGENGFISKMGSLSLLVLVSSAVLSSAAEVRNEAKTSELHCCIFCLWIWPWQLARSPTLRTSDTIWLMNGRISHQALRRLYTANILYLFCGDMSHRSTPMQCWTVIHPTEILPGSEFGPQSSIWRVPSYRHTGVWFYSLVLPSPTAHLTTNSMHCINPC